MAYVKAHASTAVRLIVLPGRETTEVSAAVPAATERSRHTSLRFFNLFRLVLAGLFVVAGRDLGLGDEAPLVFRVVALGYLGAAFGLGFREVAARFGAPRVTALQIVIDVVALSLIMWASGGYSSGIPVLIMVVLAGAGLVAEGRLVLFFAALATIAVLIENAWRLVVGGLFGAGATRRLRISPISKTLRHRSANEPRRPISFAAPSPSCQRSSGSRWYSARSAT